MKENITNKKNELSKRKEVKYDERQVFNRYKIGYKAFTILILMNLIGCFLSISTDISAINMFFIVTFIPFIYFAVASILTDSCSSSDKSNRLVIWSIVSFPAMGLSYIITDIFMDIFKKNINLFTYMFQNVRRSRLIPILITFVYIVILAIAFYVNHRRNKKQEND